MSTTAKEELVKDSLAPLRGSDVTRCANLFAVAAVSRAVRIIEGNHPLNGMGDLFGLLDDELIGRIRALRSRIHDGAA